MASSKRGLAVGSTESTKGRIPQPRRISIAALESSWGAISEIETLQKVF
jgi:hypothetical protein